MPAEPDVDAERLEVRHIADRRRVARIGEDDGRVFRDERGGRGPAGDTRPEDHRVAPREPAAHPRPPRAMKSA